MSVPRILIAGLQGGGGKTIVSLGLAAAWRKKGMHVAPFKKGPDYIDAAWLSMAAGRPCRNLDLFLMPTRSVLRSFVTAGEDADVAVIEGNRGLFDGGDAQGSYSTAELAKLLNTPVVLVVDCTKSTRTVAAVVLGCQHLDPDVPLAGVILNRVAGRRHESVLREAVEEICGIPVLGAVAKLPGELFPQRHLGLVPPDEHHRLAPAIERAADVARRYLDLDALWNVARQAPGIELDAEHGPIVDPETRPPVARIGIFRDAAFQFYYPENIEALVREGARVVEFSPLRGGQLPEVDALYIGGGFPETAAAELARNGPLREALRERIGRGLPVYAECGGTVYLGEKLIHDGSEYPMVGALPVVFAFQKKPQGHGYTELETVAENPFFPVGHSLRGHEFHYTYMQSSTSSDLRFAFKVLRGHGFDGQHDGLCQGNVLACYTHVHALGTEIWARSLVEAAVRFKAGG